MALVRCGGGSSVSISNYEYIGAYNGTAGNSNSLSIAGSSVTKKHGILSIYGNSITNNISASISISSISITVNGVAVDSAKITSNLTHARYYPAFEICVYDDIPAGATISVSITFSAFVGDIDYTVYGY